MGYFYLVMVALFFSFGGSSVKLIKPFFQSEMITFMRFAVGVVWLLALKTVKRHSFRKDFRMQLHRHWGWLAIGAVSKWLAYTTENYALSIGVSYGNILTQPAQIILLTVLGTIVLHDVLNWRKELGIALCVAGVFFISWNGMPLESLLQGDLFLTLLYLFSGACAGMFVFAQKKVADAFDILDSNLCMFMLSAILALILPTARGTLVPMASPSMPCILAIIWFGFVTGIGFYLNAKAIPMVPFHMVAILQSTMVFFSLAWGILFFGESVSLWILLGTVTFVAGIILMQTEKRTEQEKAVRTDD